ncbi:MAG: hypothetical protein KBS86_00335 [Proteobacteria bacterium]|nr:hypothetical protein [Candidatus Enterousia scatequi]
MLKVCKFFVCLLFGVLIYANSYAVDLSGSAVVSITSDTAVLAKNIAMAEARRQIVFDKLGQYADKDQLRNAMAQEKDLSGLISQTSIDGEKISDTTYSATVHMTIDPVVAQQWMVQHGVQNWLQSSDVDSSVLIVKLTLNAPLSDWGTFNALVNKIDYRVSEISGNTVTIVVPQAQRSQFTAAVYGAGWQHAVKNDVLNIWR